MGLVVKNLPVNAGDTRDAGLILGLGRFIGVGNGTLYQYACLEIPWTEESARLQSLGLQRVGGDWAYEILIKNVFNHICVYIWWYQLLQSLIISQKNLFINKHSLKIYTAKPTFLVDSLEINYICFISARQKGKIILFSTLLDQSGLYFLT